MHILIFLIYQISSFRAHRLNIKLFWKKDAKGHDLSFNVHLSTRQRINTSGHIACVAGILTRQSLHSHRHQLMFYIACEIEGTKNGSNKVRRQTYN